jgi:serpin B
MMPGNPVPRIGRAIAPALRGALLAIAVATPAAAQEGHASIVGEIRDASGRPIYLASIVVMGTPRGAVSDTLGRFELGALSSGPIHLLIRAISMEAIDTTIALRPGERRLLRLVMRVPEWVRRGAQAESARVAAGGVDSLAEGLLATDSAGIFGYERFGIGLLRALVRDSAAAAAWVVSPLSAGQAMALALAAARDSTAIAIARGLHTGSLDPAELGRRTRRFNDGLRSRRDVTLMVANALWVDTSATLKPDFQRLAATEYGAAVRSVPLGGPEVVPLMNRWADSATAGRIPKIREKPYARDILVVLTNAVYYKGLWLEPFDSTLTRDREFTTARGTPVVVPTMERTAGFAYRRATGYQALRVPYRAGLTAMYLVLPDSGVPPQRVLDSLAGAGWPLPDPGSDTKAVHLRLPRLHVSQKIDLKPPFTALGMGIVFDSTRADFSGLALPRPRDPPRCPPISQGVVGGDCARYVIDEATQHVYLEVDERGTEAAAVTTLALAVVTSVPPPPIPFFIDRPFLLALRDEKTGTFLFMAYVGDPRP